MIRNNRFMSVSKSNFVFLKKKYAYHILILFGVIAWTILLTRFFQESPLLDKYYLSLFLFLLALFDFMLTILWAQGASFISSDKATIFSNHRFRRYKYFLGLIFFDLKSIIFIMPALVIGLFIMIKVKLLIGLIAIIFFWLFFMCIELWFLSLYFLSKRLNLRKKTKNIILPLVFIGSIIILSSNDRIISNLPIIGWTGNGIFNAINGNWVGSLSYFLLLMLISLLGFFLGLKLLRSQINTKKNSVEKFE